MIAFFALTFALSWSCFFAAAALVRPGGSLTDGIAGAVYLAGVAAPAIVAIALTAATRGRAPVRLPSSERNQRFRRG